jgi:hypothetical protein
MIEQTNNEIVLEELRRAFDTVNAANDALDAKLNNLLNFSSLILSFAATIQISMLESRVGVVFWILIGVALVLYIVNFVRIKSGLNPKSFHCPMSGDRDVIVQKYFDSPKIKVLNQIIGNYLDAIEEINATNEKKARAIETSYRLLIGIVAALILAVPLGLIFKTPTPSDFLNTIYGIARYIIGILQTIKL